jgi:uncharacterized membrane protein YedE/YeeE
MNLESARVRGMLALGLGALFGFSLSRIGFTSYDELHKMFVFSDLRLLFVFMGAVVISAIGTRLVPIGRAIPARPIQKSVAVGGLIFGVGWVLSGACPGVALAQLGEGKLFSVFTIAGIVTGTLAFGPINQRFLKWSVGTCG